MPSGTTVITSAIATLDSSGTANAFNGATGSNAGSQSYGDDSGSSSSSLSKGAIIAIAVSIGVIGLLAIVLTIIRKRQQARSRSAQPLNFSPAGAYGDGGVTRRSQESWLGGRPMSGVSGIEPDMMPPMEEYSRDGHYATTNGSHGAFYETNDGMPVSMPSNAYAVGGATSGRPISGLDSQMSHGWANATQEGAPTMSASHSGPLDAAAYYDGSAAAGYTTSASRGSDLAAAGRSGSGSPYEELQRGGTIPYGFRPDHEEQLAMGGPEQRAQYDQAFGAQDGPFGDGNFVPHNASRWSG